MLTEEFTSEQGLACSPKGDEIWFTAIKFGERSELRAVDLKGRSRDRERLAQRACTSRILPLRLCLFEGTSLNEDGWVIAAAIPAVVAKPKLAFDAQARLHSERAHGGVMAVQEYRNVINRRELAGVLVFAIVGVVLVVLAPAKQPTERGSAATT